MTEADQVVHLSTDVPILITDSLSIMAEKEWNELVKKAHARAARRPYEKEYRERPESRKAKNARSKRYRSEPGYNRELERRRIRRHKAKPETKAKATKRQRLRNYNLSAEQYDALFLAQGKACAACGSVDPKGRNWHIDHDHACCSKAGKSCGRCVRGILCSVCNLTLGQAQDEGDRLRKLIQNLEKWPGPTTGC